MSRKKKEKKSLELFQTYYDYWLTRMLYVASSAIEWTNLPYTCDPVYLENTLNMAGAALIMREPMREDYLVGENGSTGEINIYGYPKNRRVIFMNGKTVNTTPEESVIIYNNAMRSSDLWYFTTIAQQMADIDMAVRVNMQTQKTMPIIPATQEQALSIENVYSDLENNIPYIMVDSNSFDAERFRNALQFDNRKSFTSDLMIQVQREIWNRFLTFVGVNNVNVEKRERVNVPEINSNLDEILVMRRNRLNARERACAMINEKWGLNVGVRYYSDVREVNENGSLYGYDQNDLRTTISRLNAIQKPGYIEGKDNR